MNAKQYDVLVCGRGLVGLAAALAMARMQLKTAVLGPAAAIEHNLGSRYHSRIYAISNQSQAYLQQLGVWGSLPQDRICPVSRMVVTGDQGGRFTFDAYQAVMPQLACIMEAGEIEHALYAALKLLGVEFIDDHFLRKEGDCVVTRQGITLQSRLLIGADGAQSAVRAAAGIAFQRKPYGHTGLVCQFNAAVPHGGTAWQWFDNRSILAFLPLPDTQGKPQFSMVWSMPAARAQTWLDLPEAEQDLQLPLALSAVSHGRLGELQKISPLKGFPLALAKSDLIGKQTALVGDAAHQVHPLAGQGLNLGLGDVEVLARVIHEREAFRDIGDPRLLERYRLSRTPELFKMRLATDSLHRLFNEPLPGTGLLRNLGMSALEKSPWIKRWLVQSANGKHL